MPEILPVLVVGAGPAGLVAALALAQNGIKLRLIDKAERPHVGNRGFGVQPRTCELFQTLGILDDFLERATPIPTMRAYKLPGGTVPVKTWDLYPKTGAWPDRPFGNGLCLDQSELEDILRRHLAKYGVEVEYGRGLVDIEQTLSSVKATVAVFNDGKATPEREIITSQYLIGTDGARGATRKLLGLTFQGETRDADGMVWGDVEIEGLTTEYWHIWGKPGSYTIMARPIRPDGKKFGIGITGLNFDPAELAEEEKVKQFFFKETGRTDLIFGKFSWLSYFRPNMRMVNKFREGRAFVAGDSGHVHSPTGGQGMNCSVQDSSNIAWKLSNVLKNIAAPTLLDSYNEERLPVIAQMLQATSSLYTHTVPKAGGTLGQTPSTEIATEEDDRKSGWFRWRNNALEMYGINYRFSDIVLEERESRRPDPEDQIARAYDGYEGQGTLVAGDRAPQAPGLVQEDGMDTSLFELFRINLHTVLIFVTKVLPESVSVAKNWQQSIVQVFVITGENITEGFEIEHATRLRDHGGYANAAYRIEDGLTVVVVRPDGFVGAIGKDLEIVDRYFAKVSKSE